LLSVAFAVQVAPAIWVAYRRSHPSGVAVGTWLLVAGELTCWGVYGVHRSDSRLMTMGVIGGADARSCQGHQEPTDTAACKGDIDDQTGPRHRR
jgi:hypothetical protein